MSTHPVSQQKVEEAERKVSAVLEELEDVVDTDPASGRPAVHQAVDITVAPRAQRRWLK